MPEIVPSSIAFVVGGLLGWLGCWLSRKNRPSQPDARLEEELRQQLRQREQELESGRARITQTTAALAAAEANRDSAQRLLDEARATHAENLRAAKEAQEKAMADLREAFKALSADALRQTAPQFLQLANETFAKFQESAKGDLAARQQSIATLVQPLKEQLESYQRRLQQSETSQASVLGEVKKQLEGLAQNSQALSTETFQLRKVLSSNQARGRWGEETLRRVVEAAGMSPHCDFTEQTQSDDKKPDLIVRLPGERMIIIDAKVPDLDFLHAIDSADPAARAQALSLHAARLKDTIRDLAKKDYPAQFPAALDHVVLFLPGRIAIQRCAGSGPGPDPLGRAKADHAGDASVIDRFVARCQRELAATGANRKCAGNRGNGAGAFQPRGKIFRALRQNPRRTRKGQWRIQRRLGQLRANGAPQR